MIAISNIVSDMFSPSRSSMKEQRAKAAGKKARKQFGRFYQRMKDVSRLLNARSKAVADLNQFDQANAGIPDTGRVATQNDVRRAKRLLILTFLFESFLSYKGSQYLLETFLAISIPVLTLIMAVVVAAFAITQSINIRHFANRYKKAGKQGMFYAIAAGSYLLVFIVPTANILEGLNTIALHPEGLSPEYQTFNTLVVLFTLGVHITLINMADVFIEADNAKKAGEQRDRKTKAIAVAERAVEEHSVKYETAREAFTESVRDFVGSYLDLRGTDEEAARRIVNHLDVRLIWLINRLFGHKVLPYPTNEEGQIESTEPFNAELRGIADIMDQMDTITVSTGVPAGSGAQADEIDGREEMLPETGQPEREGAAEPEPEETYTPPPPSIPEDAEEPYAVEVDYEGGINPRDREL